MIQLLDKQRLEAEACECYRVVRNHLETFAEFDTGFETQQQQAVFTPRA